MINLHINKYSTNVRLWSSTKMAIKFQNREMIFEICRTGHDTKITLGVKYFKQKHDMKKIIYGPKYQSQKYQSQ